MFAKPVRVIPQPHSIKRRQPRPIRRPTTTRAEPDPAASTRPIRVLLVEELDLVRDALVTLLSWQPDFEVIAGLG